MEKNEQTAVALEHLFFSYEKDALTIEDVSFEVAKGEYMCLIGHNGSGKSTLARLIIGLLAQSKGAIKIFGSEMNDDNVLELRKKMGIIFQNPDNQFIGSTVRDDIAFGLENECVPSSQMEGMVEEYAKKVGMEAFLDKEPTNLSGGQKQRVAIAGALVRHPEILIMDEATSMLDPKGKREIISLIHKAKEENPSLTIISITHDIEEAYQADHVVVLSEGKKVLDGTPKEVFADEQELTKINLDLPFYKRLSSEMEKQGLDFGDISSLEELERKLCL
ncbi:MAG: energy-coupling factor transporter ATPase [Bacilli bacterium]|nr:energy-coupling factor transporter ATPase [Bacilli bacterium]